MVFIVPNYIVKKRPFSPMRFCHPLKWHKCSKMAAMLWWLVETRSSRIFFLELQVSTNHSAPASLCVLMYSHMRNKLIFICQLTNYFLHHVQQFVGSPPSLKILLRISGFPLAPRCCQRHPVASRHSVASWRCVALRRCVASHESFEFLISRRPPGAKYLHQEPAKKAAE